MLGLVVGACGPRVLQEDDAGNGDRPDADVLADLDCQACTNAACTEEIDACAADSDCACVVECLEDQTLSDEYESAAFLCADYCGVRHLDRWEPIGLCAETYCDRCPARDPPG